MSIFQAVRNHYPRWRTVLPLQDGRECPECFAVVVGGGARIAHRRYHAEQRKWQEMMVQAAADIAAKAGLTAQLVHLAPDLVTMNVHPDISESDDNN